MRLSKLAFIFLILSFAVASPGCDGRKGMLTEKETNKTYSEMKTTVENGDLWRLIIQYNHQVDSLGDNSSFLRSAIETVFKHEDQITGKYGIRYHQYKGHMVVLQCQILLIVDENEYTIDEIYIGKIDDRVCYDIRIVFHWSGEEVYSDYIEVELQ